MMPLKLRPTGLGSAIDKNRPDYAVCTGEWEVGRIYETRGGPLIAHGAALGSPPRVERSAEGGRARAIGAAATPCR
jgi:hypothetical protein